MTPTYWGEPLSDFRDAERQFMLLALMDENVRDFLWNEFRSNYRERGHLVSSFVLHFVGLCGERPWRIPTEAELDEYCLYLPTPYPRYGPDRLMTEERDYWVTNKSKARFSAAAAAIYFLDNTSSSTRA